MVFIKISYCLWFYLAELFKSFWEQESDSLFNIFILPPILLLLGLCCPGCLHHSLTPTPLYTRAISVAVGVFNADPQICCSLLWHWDDSCSSVCGTWGTAMFHCYCVCSACCLLWPLVWLVYTVCSNGLHTSNYSAVMFCC